MMRRVQAQRLVGVLVAVVVATACSSSGGLFRQYEYEEDVYLSLDGSATVYVNSSLAALNALRGTTFSTRPNAQVNRAAVRAFFTTSHTRVRTPTTSRRNNRRFVHVRLDVDDVRTLGRAAPFAWSEYEYTLEGDVYRFQQRVGTAAGKDVGDVGWTGRELVAFRLHLPSDIVDHNAGAENHKRGNILVWEQTLADRLRGRPLTLDARMRTQSILVRTLALFGATIAAVAAAMVTVIWWIRRG
jgi:hypothetical protein